MLNRLKEALFREPAVVPFVECPNCKNLLELGSAHCPRCLEEIDPNYAGISAIIVHHNTQACSVANTIATLDAFIPIAVIGTAVFGLISFFDESFRLMAWCFR